MTLKTCYRTSCALLGTLAMLQPTVVLAQEAPGDVTIAPRSSDTVQRFATNLAAQPKLSTARAVQRCWMGGTEAAPPHTRAKVGG